MNSPSMSGLSVSPVLALRRAVLQRLAEDVALVALLGGVRIHETVPRGAEGLYVVIGEARVRDWSSGDAGGHAHEASLVVWSKPGGALPALAVSARIAALLDDAALVLEGHRLVLLRVSGEEVRRDERADISRVVVRLSALTEVL